MKTISLVVVVFAAPSSAAERPRLRATRVDRAPAMDPTLADGIWSLAQPSDQFTQKFPAEGQPPVEPTTVRVVYDRDALYVRFDCEQRLARVVQRLTRRGRLVESDWVSIGLGTRRDGKSAFEFLVNASGVLVDTLRYNDTDTAGSWDENWEARAALTPVGWSAVFKIPLRILRFEELPLQSWDLQARRYVSERQETDEWAFIPRSLGGEVSHYGRLDGLRGLRRGTQIELLPFVLGRFRRRDAVSGQLASGTDWSGSAGLNLKWHPTQALTLDLAINPDFGQVDPDQLVLNLTQFETYYPEQRPFFNEGIDTFATPMQLLYTRRIGRAPPLPTLRTNQPFGEQLVDVPEADTIYGAAKLTGRIANRWTIGFLEAVTGRNYVDVQSLDGVRARRLVAPLTSFTVLRLKRDLGSNAEIGLTTTAKVSDEPVGTYPWLPPTATAPALQLCPSGLLVSLPSRCFNNSYVGGIDWRWRSPGGAWVTGGQAAMSFLDRGPPRYVRDGTVLRPEQPGTAVVTYLNKEGGQHWVGDVGFEFDDRKFDANDLGFDRRANNYRWRADLEYRELRKWWILLESHARFEYFARTNLNGLDLGSGYQVNVSGKFTNFWRFFTELHYRAPYFDDREVGDGTALERAGLIGYELDLSSDATKRVSFSMSTQTQFLFDGFNFSGRGTVLLRVLPQFDFDVSPTVRYTFGEPRYIGNGVEPGQYLFGAQEAESIGITLHATYTFAPRLTLQAYAQLFLASEHYSKFSSFQANTAGPRPAIRLSYLKPLAGMPPQNPDFEQGALNINLVLRWEYRLGSVLFLVYTRSQVPNFVLLPGQAAALDLGAIGRGPASDVVIAKLTYWWG